METNEFTSFRKQLGKTQKQIARLLGVSLKAVHSYEQGWRSVPDHIEKQMLLLMVQAQKKHDKSRQPCWEVYTCPPEKRNHCPAWEFQTGDLCWFINGTFCKGDIKASWQEKMRHCRSCDMLRGVL